MAERNPQILHSLQSLLYLKRNGNYCGYKLELITDNISTDLREFLICSECKGISRGANHVGGKTMCEMCNDKRCTIIIDERVQNRVASLNSKCPLWEKNCEWKGKLADIEQHMVICAKMLVKCQLKCGEVFERETRERHNKEVCPLRMIECQYCTEEVQANKMTKHIGECTNHPDTVIPCPYKELGCNAIVLRKNKDIHLTENMIGHQRLMLDQLSQLRNRNQQLEQLQEEQRGFNGQQSSRIRSVETLVANGRSWGIGIERKRDKDKKRLVIALVAVGIGIAIAAIIGIPIAATQGNKIQANSQEIGNHSQQIGYSLQFIETLMSSLGYINVYIEERGKLLQGREWTHYVNSTSYSGPAFYLEQCKLKPRIKVSGSSNGRIYVQYYVERVEGEYDDLFNNCKTTYVYATYLNLNESQYEDPYSSVVNYYFYVGSSRGISYSTWIDLNTEIQLRVYFDTEGT